LVVTHGALKRHGDHAIKMFWPDLMLPAGVIERLG
jgi:hypothetical protein